MGTIRYGYDRRFRQPAPAIAVTLRNPVTGDELQNLGAQLDTGADRSVLPESLALTLGLARTSQSIAAGFGGEPQPVSTYAVLVRLHDLPFHLVQVFAHPKEDWILLGRDILNHYRILLDGPGLAVEIL